MALLAEVPGGKLQLFKFREMYEKRYHDSIGVSDLYKMKDVVSITGTIWYVFHSKPIFIANLTSFLANLIKLHSICAATAVHTFDISNLTSFH